MRQRCNHRRPLSSAELEYNLCVFPVERRFDSQIGRMVKIAQGSHFFEDYFKFIVRRFYSPEIHYTHIHEMRLPGGINTHNPET